MDYSTPQCMMAVIIDGQLPFGLIYYATIIAGTGYLLALGYFRKYPLSIWSAFVLTVSLLFILGLNISAYSSSELVSILIGHDFSPRYSKTASTAFVLGIFGVIIAKYALRIKQPLADDLVMILPVMNIIQRSGCLFNGCCHGSPTSLPWGIKYTYTSFLAKYGEGLGPNEQQMENVQAVHPTQAYIILGSFLILIALIIFRKKFKNKGSTALAGILLLLSLRFLVEFLKVDDINYWYTQQWFHLKAIQWGIVAVNLLLIILLIKNEYKKEVSGPISNTYSTAPLLNCAYITVIIIVYAITNEILELGEILIIDLLFILAIIPNAYMLLKGTVLTSLNRSMVALIFLGLLSMGQIAVDTTHSVQKIDQRVRGWFDFGLGFAGGIYNEVIVHRNCSGDIISREYIPRRHSTGFFNFNYNYKPRINQHFRLGLNLYYSGNSTSEYNEPSYSDLVINPNFSFDMKSFGFGLGMHITTMDPNNSFIAEQEITSNAVPAIYLRWGPRKYFFGDVGYFWNFHSIGLPAQFQFGAGSGFGRDDLVLRFGYSWITEHSNLFYISMEYKIKKLAILNAGIAVPNKIHGFIGMQFPIGQNYGKSRRP